MFQVSHLLADASSGKAVLGAQEAAMMVWALAVLHEVNPTIWTALLDIVAAAPAETLDEVAHQQRRSHAITTSCYHNPVVLLT